MHCDVNESSDAHTPPSNSFSFDLNEDLFVEEDIHMEGVLHESNLNTELNGDINQSQAHATSNISLSSNLSCDNDENIMDEVTNLELSEASTNTHSKKKLSNDVRKAIYESLLEKSVEKNLKKGVTKFVASQFSVTMHTVQRIWKRGKENCVYGDVSHRMKKNCGRKKIQLDVDQIRGIPLSQRTIIRCLSHALNMSKTTIHRRLKSGVMRRHSNPIKPFLNEENKRSRLRFCISMPQSASLPHDPIFSGMYNIIHIDEKWFYMTKKSENYYLVQDEEDPIRTCRSKNFIEKVMFLAAIARPRFDSQGNELFSGKIGIFPFITQEPSKRSSVNRVAGTLETKPITSVNKQVIKTFLFDKVLATIKAKWPREDLSHPIFSQQDNARTHIDCNDDDFRRVASQDGFDIRMTCQPPNSPDLNILDLGFFNAIQSLQYKESPKSIDDLLKAVEKSFEELSAVKSNHIFLSLQSCMIEIMKARSFNKYKIPHMQKEMLERQGELPIQLKCDPKLVQDVLNYLG
ncbi:uncharacterized protein LOC131649505 [Vicia villosa]|uniref:uncharacterized protein LOC131649505 n=1 Tax=Vicia villosa TaxID=3911 RepID=UPI00273CA445|nr:uncharacterized protein LOC131649505 [Vicia villosa]